MLRRDALKQKAHTLVKRTAYSYDVVRPPAPGVVILAYHRIGGKTQLELDIEPAVFADQMHWLAEQRTVITLDDAVERLERPGGQPVTAVTFDDGTADFVDHALPALVDAGVSATYYVATDFIEEGRDFPDGGTPLSWAALAEAVSTGLVTVGSHTHTHAVMDKLSPEKAESELRRSKELIEDRLGVTANHFAYPKGVPGPPSIATVVGRHFRSAAVADCGVNRYGDTDLLHLDRTPVQRSDPMTFFCSKSAGGMRLEGVLRTALNRRRYRSAAH